MPALNPSHPLGLSLYLEYIDSLHLFEQNDAWHAALDEAIERFGDIPELLLRKAVALNDHDLVTATLPSKNLALIFKLLCINRESLHPPTPHRRF